MTNEQKLEQQIESAVGEYLRASKAIAERAVQRVFASAVTPPARAASASERSKPTTRRIRRSAAEIAALDAKLIAAVRTHPGETMKTLASHVGVSPAELQMTVSRLKREGGLRVVGNRQFSRYFSATDTSQEKVA